MSVFRLACFLPLLFVYLLGELVHSHEISSGYLTLDGNDTQQMAGELALSPYDVEIEVKLDVNFDGTLTPEELRTSEPALKLYFSRILAITQEGKDCAITFSNAHMTAISGQDLIALPFTLNCPGNTAVSVRYDGIFDEDASHTTLMTVSLAGNTQTDMFTHAHRLIDIVPLSAWSVINTFVYQGIIHIWIGIDHILFLLATLLTVNLTRVKQRWQGEQNKRRVLKSTVYLVTAFTLAHSITLTTTALGWYHPSSRWVEFGIAVSVMLTALNNIWPVVHRLAFITFAFGLLHGMGFASVFGELQSNATSPLLAIASFNIGVEIGQLVIVLLVLPLLLAARHVKLYASTFMPACSLVIALVALNWAIQRF